MGDEEKGTRKRKEREGRNGMWVENVEDEKGTGDAKKGREVWKGGMGSVLTRRGTR